MEKKKINSMVTAAIDKHKITMAKRAKKDLKKKIKLQVGIYFNNSL